eukprot:445545-Ditylum_brightwellii.AAC.1
MEDGGSEMDSPVVSAATGGWGSGSTSTAQGSVECGNSASTAQRGGNWGIFAPQKSGGWGNSVATDQRTTFSGKTTESIEDDTLEVNTKNNAMDMELFPPSDTEDGGSEMGAPVVPAAAGGWGSGSACSAQGSVATARGGGGWGSSPATPQTGGGW